MRHWTTFLLPNYRLLHYQRRVTSQCSLIFWAQLPEENRKVKDKLTSLLATESERSWNKGMSSFDERFDMGINNVLMTRQDFIIPFFYSC